MDFADTFKWADVGIGPYGQTENEACIAHLVYFERYKAIFLYSSSSKLRIVLSQTDCISSQETWK